MSDWVAVARSDEIAPGHCKVIEVDGVMIAVFNVNGQHLAIEDVCTHDGGELASGTVEGEQVICPRHGARFCLRSGQALTPPAYEPVHCYPVRNEGGLIQVRDDRWD
jgi:3-phenylpropionate/trans-cinnamate dioxygenase ferredoxin subunit